MYFKKVDIIPIIIILAVGAFSWLAYRHIFSDKPAKAEIYYNSELVLTVDLDTGEERLFSIPQNENVVFHLFRDGSICFESSDCPDKVCVNTGKIRTPGEFAACLPNKIVLKIVPKTKQDEKDLDITVGKAYYGKQRF